MNDQNNSQPRTNNSVFENSQNSPSPVKLFEDPQQSSATAGYAKENMPPQDERRPFPFFHLSVLALILGVAGWFWFNGKLDMDVSEESSIQTQSNAPVLSAIHTPLNGAKVSGSTSEPSKTDFVSPQLSLSEVSIPPEVVSVPEVEDPATKLFGVVSRIRSSRTNP